MNRLAKCLLAICLTALFGSAAYAKTIAAKSCSQGDVQSAINSASNGDTVTVPGGSCTWNSIVNISDAHQITLDGGGKTTITWGSGMNVTAGTTTNTIVTGFTFNGAFPEGGCPIKLTTATSPLTQPFRFHDNTLNGGTTSGPATALCTTGNGPGLIDHNTFNMTHGADEMIHVLGNGPEDSSGWTDTVTPGGPNMIFIEDNTFTETGVIASALQSYYGARTVARHNTFRNAMIDQHGGGGVGARWWEFYDNNFPDSAPICLRAGSGVVFSNTGAGAIRMVQESGAYPAKYQVGRGQNEGSQPAYEWNNGGTPLQLNTQTGCAAGEANMIQLNRDVYESASGMPNYTPYTYPHPLTQGNGKTKPALVPPSNLSVSTN